MKTQFLLQKLGISTITLVCFLSSFPLPTLAEKRHLLGETVLTYAENDRDVLYLGKCPPHDSIRSIKIRATRGAADIELLRVKFQNGESQDLSVRENLPQGKESRWIDLRGKKRCVTSVTIMGDTDNRSNKRAMLQVFGK
jgi:Protein of unknown function (DUF2541)